MKGDDSANTLPSSSHRASAPISQARGFHCSSYSFITTLYFNINILTLLFVTKKNTGVSILLTFLENYLPCNIIMLKGKSIGKAGKFN